MNFKPENTLTQKIPSSHQEEGNKQHEQVEALPQSVEQFLDTASTVHDTIETLGEVPKEKVPPSLFKNIGATFNRLKPYALAAFLALQSFDGLAQNPGNPFEGTNNNRRREQTEWEQRQQKNNRTNKAFGVLRVLSQDNPAMQQVVNVAENAVRTGQQIKQQAEWERQQREQQQQWQNQR